MIRALIVASMLLASTQAMAWTNITNGHNNQIVDGGPGAQANQTQRQTQHQIAKGGAGGNATGGNATGGNAKGGAGYGGSATGNGGSLSVIAPGRAPDIALPSFGGGGMDCPTVGFGAGGSGLGGGGGIGPSWISSDCNKRKTAALLAALYDPSVARAYAEKNIDGVKEAVAATRSARIYPNWCRTNDGVWLGDLPECTMP